MTKDDMIRFILTRKYFLKQYGIRPGKWRKKISAELLSVYGVGHSDMFIECWIELSSKNLI